jgi:L-lactate utilization protein LutC
MDAHQINWRERVAQHLIKTLTKRRMEATFAQTAEQAKREVIDMIPEGASVYRCGSTSLAQMGLWEGLQQRPEVEVIDPFRPELKPDGAMAMRIKGMTADFLITSSNAITLDGKIVNLDATGNRVAAICFGPKKVILVVGMNKVVPDLDAALKRVKHYVAPVNAMRLKLKTPCVETGHCNDCDSPDRICNMWSIIEGHRLNNRIHVKLVGEDLGY